MKKSYVFVPFLLCFVFIFVYCTPSIVMSENISEKVFRLHILANSDEDNDQQLKLKVRDDILSSFNYLYIDCKSFNDAIADTKVNLEYIKECALKTIKLNGYNYSVKVQVDKEYFNTREYDVFTLPAGYYNTLKVIIGEGKGHNWWCVMYPSVCLSGCVDDFDNELTEEEKNFITNTGYDIRFKTIEIYEKIKSSLKI